MVSERLNVVAQNIHHNLQSSYYYRNNHVLIVANQRRDYCQPPYRSRTVVIDLREEQIYKSKGKTFGQLIYTFLKVFVALMVSWWLLETLYRKS